MASRVSEVMFSIFIGTYFGSLDVLSALPAVIAVTREIVSLATSFHHRQFVAGFFFVAGGCVIDGIARFGADVLYFYWHVRRFLGLLVAQALVEVRLPPYHHVIQHILLDFRPSVQVSQSRHVHV